MNATEYKKAFEQARADLESLVEEREAIDKKIAQVKQALVALAPMVEEKQSSLIDLIQQQAATLGITDAIREVLRSAKTPLTPIEVRDRLVSMKPDVKTQANLMASIHSVLKRLIPDEATVFTSKQGDVVYKWIGNSAYSNLFISMADALGKFTGGVVPGASTPNPAPLQKARLIEAIRKSK
jgi:hypothetical protein